MALLFSPCAQFPLGILLRSWLRLGGGGAGIVCLRISGGGGGGGGTLYGPQRCREAAWWG